MSTSSQLTAKAMRRLQLLDAHESPSAADDAHANSVLLDIIAEFEATGLALTSADLPLPAKYESALVAILAARLAGDFGRPVDEALDRDARSARHTIAGGYFEVPAQAFEEGLLNPELTLLGNE